MSRLVVAAAALAVSCGGAATARRSAVPTGSVPLVAVPAAVVAACGERLASLVPVRCPAAWPPARMRRPPALRWITRSSQAYLLNAFNGLDDRGQHIFHLLLGGQTRPFNADWTGIDLGLRVTEKVLRIPVRGGGTFIAERPARRIGAVIIHGTTGLLLLEPDYPQGGLQGGHVIVLWNEAGDGYLVSAHGTDRMPAQAVRASAVALARSAAGP
jgi:hypothetical protein